MAGPNKTGTADSKSYNLGRGIVYVSVLTAAGLPTSWRDLGNAPAFTCTSSDTVLEHKSSRGGLATIDRQITTEVKLELGITLDEFNFENLSTWLFGTEGAYTNGTIAGFSNYVMVPDGNLALGRWYDIQSAAGVRCYQVDTADLTVTTNEGSPTPMVLNTDYTVDTVMGRIFVLATSTVAATSITAVKGLKVTLTADADANLVDSVKALLNSGLLVAVKFIGSNPADSDKLVEYEFHQVTLKADSDLALIGDTFAEMKFKGVAEKNTNALYASSPTLDVRYPNGQ